MVIIQTDLGLVDTETGIVKQEWDNSEEFHKDREFTWDSSIILTYIAYGNLIKIHREMNNEDKKRDVKCECGRTIQKSFHSKHIHTGIHYRLIHGIKKERVKYKKKVKCHLYEEALAESLVNMEITKKRIKKIRFDREKYYEDNHKIMIKKSLDYYYRVDKVERLKKITCECGRIVSKGNLTTHLKSKIHKRRLKSKI